MNKFIKFLHLIIDNLLNWLKTLKSGKVIAFIACVTVCIITCIGGCRSPTSASAQTNLIGGSEYVYSLPPVTLSNSVVNQAFIPNVFLCFSPSLSDYGNSVYMYTLTGSSSRNAFSYGRRDLSYNSSTLQWELTDFRTVTLYGFNVSSNASGNAINWSSDSGAITVSVNGYSQLRDNNADFEDGSYTVNVDFVRYEMYNQYGSIVVTIPYTSYNTSTTFYTGTFNPTRILGSNLDFQTGYNFGYDEGYIDGDRDGYNRGITTNFGDISPFRSLVSFINNLMSTDIIPGVPFSYLIYVAFGFVVLTLIVKLV